MEPTATVSSQAKPFRVHLQGITDVVSRHLYTQGPEVFIRELLQNSVDGISARMAINPDFEPLIEVEVLPYDTSPGTLTVSVSDNGVGLRPEEVESCLATIGFSSKRGQKVDFIGQFGIGLLSCFMVADEVTVISSREPFGPNGFNWVGRVDGSWNVSPLIEPISQGTRVFLKLRTTGRIFTGESLLNLTKKYGRYLKYPVHYNSTDTHERVNAEPPPWKSAASNIISSEHPWIDYGEKALGKKILGGFRFESAAVGAEGIAFIEESAAQAGSDPAHILYVRGMFVGEKIRGLAPAWAPFLRCVLDSHSMQLSASREALHGEETRLETLQRDVAVAFRAYLDELSSQAPQL